MDLSPDEATRYLEGVDYPDELLERLRTLGRPGFSGPDEVVAEASPTAG